MNLRRQLTSDSMLKLGRVALVGLAVSLSAVACTFSAGDDNEPNNGHPSDTGGMGGEATGGSATGGETASGGTNLGGETGSGGDTGTGGQDPVTNVDCHEGGNVEGTPADPDPALADPDNKECDECLRTTCADAYADCYATGPDSICGWGPDENTASEFQSAYDCMTAAFDGGNGDFLGTQEEVDACLEAAASASCGGTDATSVTRTIVECLTGLNNNSSGCMDKCALQ